MFASLSNWFKTEINGVKRYAIYGKGLGAAFVHGGLSSLSAVLGASALDYSKFNLTNGLRSELDLLVLVFCSSGAVAGIIYVKTNSVPKA